MLQFLFKAQLALLGFLMISSQIIDVSLTVL